MGWITSIRCCGGFEGFARALLLGTNFIFFGLSIFLFIIGLIAGLKAKDFETATSIVEPLNMSGIAWTILATALITFVFSVIGFAALKYGWSTFLKFYIVFLFFSATVQFAMGIFLHEVKVSTLDTEWFNREAQTEDPAEINQQRENMQNYLHCCGWEWVYDSVQMGTLCINVTHPESAPCPSFNPEVCKTCSVATTEWVQDNMLVAGGGAIALSVIELCAILLSSIVVYQGGKEKPDFWENAFHY